MLCYVLVLLSGVKERSPLGGVSLLIVGDAEEVDEDLEVLDLPLCCQVEDVGLEVLEQSAVPSDQSVFEEVSLEIAEGEAESVTVDEVALSEPELLLLGFVGFLRQVDVEVDCVEVFTD